MMTVKGQRLGFLWVVPCVFVLASPTRAQVGFRQLTSTHPVAVQRGSTAEVRLRSSFTLDDTYGVFFSQPGITMTFLETKAIDAPRKGRMVIFKFPSEESAKAWYADPDYQALSEHRRQGTNLEFITMVHGIPSR